MKITVYKKYGFCWGVERAIKLAKETLEHEKNAYILGEIIHNPFTNKELSKMGLKIVKTVNEVPLMELRKKMKNWQKRRN